MANLRNRFPGRRRFLKQSAALTAASASLAPILVLAQSPAPAAPAKQSTPDDASAASPAQGRRPPRAPGEGS
jgi:hypothetical protein